MKALQTIQQKLNAPKDKYNSFGKYKYRSCEGILNALKPLLNETNSTLFITDDIVEIGGRIYVKATATFTDDKGTQVTATAFAREEEKKSGMDGAQATGAASSYARKYALNALFLIDDAQDPDTDEYQRTQRAAATPKQATLNLQQEPMPTITLAGFKDINERTGAVKNALAICKSVRALNNLYKNLYNQDADFCEIVKPLFSARKNEIDGTKE